MADRLDVRLVDGGSYDSARFGEIKKKHFNTTLNNNITIINE